MKSPEPRVPDMRLDEIDGYPRVVLSGEVVEPRDIRRARDTGNPVPISLLAFGGRGYSRCAMPFSCALCGYTDHSWLQKCGSTAAWRHAERAGHGATASRLL